MNDITRNLHTVIDDAEQSLRHAAQEAGDEFARARSRLEKSLQSGKARLAEAGQAADGYVHRRPWSVIAVGAGLALLAGWLLGKRD